MADFVDDVIPELMPLDGLFVEVLGLQATEADGEAYDLNGERGRVIGWVDEQEKYAVQLFNGYQVFADAVHLREFIPEDPEVEGGFDVAWPWSPSAQSIFASIVCQNVSEKGFCVVQMFHEDEEDAHWMSRDLSWGMLKQEIEEEYLGQDVVDGKVAWLQDDVSEEGSRPSRMMAYNLEKDLHPDMRMGYFEALDRCDKALTLHTRQGPALSHRVIESTLLEMRLSKQPAADKNYKCSAGR